MTKSVSPQEVTALGQADDPRSNCIFYAQNVLDLEYLMTPKHPLLMRSLFARLRLFLEIVKRNDRHYPIRYAITNTETTMRKIERLYFN